MSKDQCYYLIALSLQSLFKENKIEKHKIKEKVNYFIDELDLIYNHK